MRPSCEVVHECKSRVRFGIPLHNKRTSRVVRAAVQVERQQLANPKGEGEEPYKPLAPVLENSVNWGGFMALSTNIRYQAVNGFEDRLLVRFLPAEEV